MFSDISNDEFFQRCSIFVLNIKLDMLPIITIMVKVPQPFRFRLKPNVKLLHTQRPTKVPFRYRGKLKKLLEDFEQQNIMKQISSTHSN